MILIRAFLIAMGMLIVILDLLLIYIPIYVIKRDGGIKKYFKELLTIDNILRILVALLYIVAIFLIFIMTYFILFLQIPANWV